MEENETIQEATEELNKLKDEEEMQRLALSRWIALSDYNTNMSAAKKEGKKEGIQGTVDVLRDLGHGDIEISEIIQKKYGLTNEEVAEYI